MPVNLLINETKKELPDGVTVREMLLQCAGKTQGVAVVVNEEIVPKATYDSTVLKEGDQIEILTFAGGG